MRSKERLATYGEIWTPPHIITQMHNLVPDWVWADPEVIYLEPSCGNGRFLLDAGQRCLKAGLKPRQVASKLIGIDLLKDNIQEAQFKLIKLLGNRTIIKKNLMTADFLFWVKGKEMPKRSFAKTNNLVVFGNPPYQQQSEAQKNRTGAKEQAKAIYHLFTEAVLDHLNPRYLCFITPSRWMAGGMGLEGYRERMMKDKRIRSIKHFSGETEVFTEVSIKGGTSYFLWDREYNGKCNLNGMHRHLDEYDIIVSDNKAVSILDKVRSSHPAGKFLDNKCLSRKPFGLASNFNEWKDSGIPCYIQRKVKKFVENGQFTDKNNIQAKWKACTSGGASGSFMVEPRGNLVSFVIGPNEICTETYVVVNVFDTQNEAENFITYAKTRFFRFMLGIRLITQNISKDSFAFVPDLGGYSKPVTDAELYKKFGLSEEEIAYIENKIKAL